MKGLAIIFSVLPCALSAVIYIDRFTLDSNAKYSNWSNTFTHDKNRNAIVNLSMQISKPLAKMMIYAKINLAENEHDIEFKREFLRTVFDVENMYKGSRKNFLAAAFMYSLKKFLDFEVKFPFEPVSVHFDLVLIENKVFLVFQNTYRLVNFSIEAYYLPPLPDIRGLIEFRFVGKFVDSKSMNFLALLTYYGGLMT